MSSVSIIVPVYKVEPYLSRCVDSILGQTFLDFELILVDDGSPDNCGAICDEYAAKDSRIVVIHQENGGLSAARNAGIDWVFAYSDSQWLSFIDSDDCVHPKYLEWLLNAAVEHDAEVSICGYAETTGEEPEIHTDGLAPEVWIPEDFYIEHHVNATVAWGKLYQKKHFTDNRYPIGKIHEDEFLTYKILFECEEIAFVPAPLYCYCNNPSSIVRSKWSLHRLDVLEALEERIAYFKKAGNRKMVAYSKTELKSRAALLYLQSCANHKARFFPRKYGLTFMKALRILEATCGTDRYEALLIHDYPILIKLQAHGRKIKRILERKQL